MYRFRLSPSAERASSAVLGHLFPADATALGTLAADGGNSKFYAGIHTMWDVQQGLTLGDKVGRAVVSWAKNDGSQ